MFHFHARRGKPRRLSQSLPTMSRDRGAHARALGPARAALLPGALTAVTDLDWVWARSGPGPGLKGQARPRAEEGCADSDDAVALRWPHPCLRRTSPTSKLGPTPSRRRRPTQSPGRGSARAAVNAQGLGDLTESTDPGASGPLRTPSPAELESAMRPCPPAGPEIPGPASGSLNTRLRVRADPANPQT
jgi:hypothetical protein